MRPTWRQVREFCLKQGYQERRTDHVRYVKVLPDRSTSGTMISLGVEAEQVPASLWNVVWRHQLRLASEDDFWKGLRGEPVRYAIPSVEEPPEPLPVSLVRFLRDTLHLSEAQIAALSREQAQRLLNEHYSRELLEEP